MLWFALERGEGKEKEKERNISMWLPLTSSHLGTWLASQACALTGNWTDDPLVRRPAPNPLSYTIQGWCLQFQPALGLVCISSLFHKTQTYFLCVKEVFMFGEWRGKFLSVKVGQCLISALQCQTAQKHMPEEGRATNHVTLFHMRTFLQVDVHTPQWLEGPGFLAGGVVWYFFPAYG